MFQTPNPAWPPPSLFLPVLPERNKDFSSKNWTQITGSGPMPWRQAPSLFSSSSAQLELQPRIPFEVDTRSGSDRLFSIERLSTASLERKTADKLSERLMNGSLKLGASDVLENGNAGTFSYVHMIQLIKKSPGCAMSSRLLALPLQPATFY